MIPLYLRMICNDKLKIWLEHINELKVILCRKKFSAFDE